MKAVFSGRRRLPLVLLLVSLLFGTMISTAAPARAAGAQVVSLTHLDQNLWRVVVRSPAMGHDIPFLLLRPRTDAAGAPTLYLLNGAGGGEDGANWLAQTDAQKFFDGKRVNVVIPEKGRGSYYTDWQSADSKLGKPMWQTFLTKELPPVLDAALNSSGRNAIAGLSMSGTSVLNLAIAAPGLYRTVASYSGCALTSTPEGQAAVRGIVYTASSADATNMWGGPASPAWRRNDPYLNAAKLRGSRIYLSSGSGLPGRYDTPQEQAPGAPPLADQILVGGALEFAVRYCTDRMAARLRELHIPAQVHLPATGTHSWNYWRDELKRSWPTIAAGLHS
ncbi:esterase family protein [Gordonia sp. PP30]|uniref:alpha/beta hydrolase n=1 Tax=unclassified Gordonia (in: high G+C Gram-positive bacteria) TaxID=2657482 RepID=UPI001FFFE5FC|nr:MULTISPECIES: alpha/beta hydrolase family protein [unclassified Gordonia (in: high G+C Gram-positive bacteria)]UQE75948.1 esterase family protein [Gordonia sp. PP30]